MRQKKHLKEFNKILQKVKGFRDYMSRLSGEDLSHLTDLFKERLRQGETLDDILPEAYAAICEADYRILGKFPFDVQILGAIALHKGILAEMNTGEGKTLTATMPLYLNGLSGKSTMLLTSNDYLALRDADGAGLPVYGAFRGCGSKPEGGTTFNQQREKGNLCRRYCVYHSRRPWF